MQNLTPQPIKKLVYHYWLHLEKNDYGRPAMLVEGAAGWGKDFILRKTVELWQQQKPYVHINANLNQWETLVKSVTKAQQNGCPMAISELNLVSSNDLEGLFNNLLTGDAKPGFRLFATVNPNEYYGRESMSKAFKSRCSQVKLNRLALTDMELIIRYMAGIKSSLPYWLGSRLHQLWIELEKQKSPMQLTLDDLIITAQHLMLEPESNWQKIFNELFSLPLRSIKGCISIPQEYRDQVNHDQEAEKKRQFFEG